METSDELLSFPDKRRKLLTLKSPGYTYPQLRYAAEVFQKIMKSGQKIEINGTSFYIEELYMGDPLMHPWVRVQFIKCG